MPFAIMAFEDRLTCMAFDEEGALLHTIALKPRPSAPPLSTSPSYRPSFGALLELDQRPPGQCEGMKTCTDNIW